MKNYLLGLLTGIVMSGVAVIATTIHTFLEYRRTEKERTVSYQKYKRRYSND